MQLIEMQLIQKAPSVLGGEACIGERRIAVWMLVRAKQLGMADDEIRTRYRPEISPNELTAAWKYYDEHREEIDRAIRRNEEA